MTPEKRGRVEPVEATYQLGRAEQWLEQAPEGVTLYKVLSMDGKSPFMGSEWPLPTINADGTQTPGEWREDAATLITCSYGLHLFAAPHVLQWASGGSRTRLFVAETEGGLIDATTYQAKYVARKVRLVREILGWEAYGTKAGMYGNPLVPLHRYERTLRAFLARHPEKFRNVLDKVKGPITIESLRKATKLTWAESKAELDELQAQVYERKAKTLRKQEHGEPVGRWTEREDQMRVLKSMVKGHYHPLHELFGLNIATYVAMQLDRWDGRRLSVYAYAGDTDKESLRFNRACAKVRDELTTSGPEDVPDEIKEAVTKRYS